jgi:glycerol-3-phosphate dehydrogenase (NAD(P)+)
MSAITVVGGGAWGTGISSLLAEQDDVSLWVREPEVADEINQRHRNSTYLPDIPLDERLAATTDLAAALEGAGTVLVAVPSLHLRDVLAEAAPFIGDAVPVLSLTKGIEGTSLLTMSEVVASMLTSHDPDRIGALSGPNIAREVASRQPSATVVALADEVVAAEVQQRLMRPSLRVYTNPDVVGCEIGGAVKNVIALAAGMAAGLGFGANTMAALVTRGLAELTRLGTACGGQALTFLGLAGIGDLVVTCSCPTSRNRSVGEQLGRGADLSTILSGMTAVAEGVSACGPVIRLADEAGVEVPICEQVDLVLRGEARPADAVRSLLERRPNTELHGIAP